MSHEGAVVGRIRDRVTLIGEPVTGVRPVASLDEVLFLARRDQLLDEPITEEPALAWHAYAVEYGLRIGRYGGRVAAVDVPLTLHELRGRRHASAALISAQVATLATFVIA